MATTSERAAAPTDRPQTPDQGGRMDGRFDGRAGVWEPRLLNDQGYLDAYRQAHAEGSAVRERANARLNFTAGFAAAEKGEDWQTALEVRGLTSTRTTSGEQDAYCAPHDQAVTRAAEAGKSPRYDNDGNEYVRHPLYEGMWQRVTAYGAVGSYRLTADYDFAPMTATELEAAERNVGQEPETPAVERVRLFRRRLLSGMTVEAAKAADVADEKGRWGSGVYGCGAGDDWSQTLEEVFEQVLGEGWWEQVCAEAEARGPGAYRRNLPSMAPAALPSGGTSDTSATGPKTE